VNLQQKKNMENNILRQIEEKFNSLDNTLQMNNKNFEEFKTQKVNQVQSALAELRDMIEC